MITEGRQFACILADPPWEFKTYSDRGKSRSAERHYDCMSIQELKALPIGQLAADDAVLAMWCVWPELEGALEVVKAWGFSYKTLVFCWVKSTGEEDDSGDAWGMGFWTRSNCEGVLLGTRGNPRRLDMGVHQIIRAPRGAHSEKPSEVHPISEIGQRPILGMLRPRAPGRMDGMGR